MTWTLEYSQEADNYLVGNRPYSNNVALAIYRISLSDSGIPDAGAHQLEPGILMCTIEQHTVVYERIPERQTLRILVIKPREEVI